MQLMFLLGQEINFTPATYSSESYFTPLTVECRLTHVGRSTVQFNVTTKVTDTGCLLHSSSAIIATVSHDTRKSIPLPSKFKTIVPQTDLPLKLTLYKNELPADVEVFTETFRVLPSDADFLLHTNQSSYIRFSHDAVSIFAKKGKINFLSRGNVFPLLKTMQCLYEGEVLPGNTIDVNVWHGPSTRHTLRELIKKEEKPVYHALI